MPAPPPAVVTLTPNAGNGEILYNASSLQPGDTIKLQGISIDGIAKAADIVRIDGIAGTSAAPIIITVDDTLQVGVTRTNYGIWLNGSHFKLLGKLKLIVKPSAGDTLSTGISLNGSHNFTVDSVHIERCKAGVIENPETGGLRENLYFTNLRFYNIVGAPGPLATTECGYIGSTKLKQRGEHIINDNGVMKTVNAWFRNVNFINCYAYGCDGDFIQMALCQDSRIINCHVWNYGRRNLSSHKNAFLIGGSSSITIENCSANTGSGPYVQVFGDELSVIKNCTFNSGATGEASDDGILIDKKGLDTTGLRVIIQNTSISGARRNAIRNNDAVSVQLCNVTASSDLSVTTGSFFSYFTSCSVVPPSPIKPTPTPAKKVRSRTVRVGG